MDFWTYQDEARRRTTRLIALYAGLLLLFGLLAAFAIEYVWSTAYPPPQPHYYLNSRFFTILAAVPSFFALLCLFAPASLRAGGKSVAEALHGEWVAPQTNNPLKRRLLNVVEEMAIASGMPVPPVYLLEDEPGINAFAAGRDINDAVIGVTRGALDRLDRAELQAVVAHEFSHILNGDMRLNMRFARLLFGLMLLPEISKFIVRALFSSSRRGSDDNTSSHGGGGGRSYSRGSGKGAGQAIILIAAIILICYLTGWITGLIGKIIQAAINRQREYLADASAVQFTRSGALASALKKIGGLNQKPRLEETLFASIYSHFFFCRIGGGLFNTHPPIKERIRRIEPDWDGKFIAPAPLPQPELEVVKKSTQLNMPVHSFTGGHENAAPAAALLEPLAPNEEARRILRNAAREPADACCLVFALLLNEQESVQRQQVATTGKPSAQRAVLRCKEALAYLSPQERLPLLETAIPALKTLSRKQYEEFRERMLRLIAADGVFSFSEWILYQLVTNQAGSQYKSMAAFARSGRGKESAALLLSVLAGLELDARRAQAAFDEGLKAALLPPARLPDIPDAETLDRSLETLRQCPYDGRKSFLDGAAAVIDHDGKVTPEETMFLRMISLCLAVPAPEPGKP